MSQSDYEGRLASPDVDDAAYDDSGTSSSQSSDGSEGRLASQDVNDAARDDTGPSLSMCVPNNAYHALFMDKQRDLEEQRMNDEIATRVRNRNEDDKLATTPSSKRRRTQ